MIAASGALTRVLDLARAAPAIKAAIVDPFDALSLQAALAAAELGVTPVLVGDPGRIQRTAAQSRCSIDGLLVHPCALGQESAAAAVLAADGAVAAIVKGAVHSADLLHAVLGERRLRTGRRLSHIVVTQLPSRTTPILLTDGAVNIAPNLDAKRDIARNAIELAHRLGLQTPKVALLAAVETVASSMPATVEAAALKELADRGEFSAAAVDGPLALDDAISEDAAASKGIVSAVAGSADVLLSPDIESGNLLYKAFDRLLGAPFAAVVVGAAVPIVLTSRGDSLEARCASCMLARLLSYTPNG